MWLYYALLTAVSWGLCYTACSQILKVSDKYAYLTAISLANFVFWLATAILNNSQLESLKNAKMWLVVAIFTSLLGNFCSLKAIEGKNAVLAAAVEISYPVWCWLFTFLLIGVEPISYRVAGGIVLIFLGTLLLME